MPNGRQCEAVDHRRSALHGLALAVNNSQNTRTSNSRSRPKADVTQREAGYRGNRDRIVVCVLDSFCLVRAAVFLLLHSELIGRTWNTWMCGMASIVMSVETCADPAQVCLSQPAPVFVKHFPYDR